MAIDSLTNINSANADSVNTDNVLLHELQLGSELNKSVEQTRRADFSLMLAMLAEDVREQSQFILPQTQTVVDTKPSNDELRKAFNLPSEAPLGLSNIEDIKQFNQAQQLNNISDIHLADLLSPKPLAFRDDKNFIDSGVLGNTTITCQLKHQQATLPSRSNTESALDNSVLNQPLEFNANAWLDGIESSLVAAPLAS